MTFLRAVWADLVGKRLWPVAAALVLALVAVPVALPKLTGGDPAPPAPLPAPLPAVAPGHVASVPVTVADTAVQRRPQGHYDDPFAGGPKAKAPATGGGSPTAPGPKPAPASHPAAPSAPAPAAAPVPAAHPISASPPASDTGARRPAAIPAGWRTDVRWGVPGHLERRPDIVRLKVLRTRSRGVPGLVYMGVSEGHTVAYFAVAPGVSVSGDGRCIPSVAQCDVVALGKRDAARVSIPSDDGFASYRLVVTRIAPRFARTKAEADYGRILISDAGHDELYRVAADRADYLAGFAYSPEKGVVRDLSRISGSSVQTVPEQGLAVGQLVTPGQ